MKPSQSSAARKARGRVQTMVTLSTEHVEKLDALAEARGLSKSAVVEAAIADAYATETLAREGEHVQRFTFVGESVERLSRLRTRFGVRPSVVVEVALASVELGLTAALADFGVELPEPDAEG